MKVGQRQESSLHYPMASMGVVSFDHDLDLETTCFAMKISLLIIVGLGLVIVVTFTSVVVSYTLFDSACVSVLFLTLLYLTFGVDRLFTCPALRLYQLGPNVLFLM